MGFFVPVVLDTLNFTLALLLVTLGLVVIYGLMNVINMAHGEFFLLGAYCVVLIQRAGLSFWWTLLLAPAVLALVGLAVEELVIRHVYRRFIDSILATWGISLALKQAVIVTFGPTAQSIVSPIPGPVQILGVTYPAYRLFIMGFAVILTGATFLFFYRTHIGLAVRGVIANRAMAASLNQHSTPRPFDFRHRCRSRRGCWRCYGTDHERRSANGSGVSHPGISLDSRRRAGHAARRAGRHSSNLRRYYDRVRRLDAGCSPGGRLHDGNRGDPRISSGNYGASVLRCPRSFPVRC